jgi:predicted MFS family arabinose efflux permease
LFLVGLLIEASSWRAPLFIISGGLFLAYFFYQVLPAARPVAVRPAMAGQQANQLPLRRRLRAFFDLGANKRSAWSVILAASLVMFAAMHLFINYGAWLQQEYGLGAVQLGRVALILGLADLGGSVLVSLASDRAGKRRSVLSGTVLAFLGFLCLPLFNTALLSALMGLIWVRFAFEFTVVSNMTLLSEQAPRQRGKILTLGAAASLLGSTAAGFTGPLAYAWYGVWGLGLIPAVAMLLAALLVLWRVREANE